MMNSATPVVLEQAAASREGSDVARALAFYSEVLEQDAGNVEALTNLAVLLFRREEFELAASLYGALLALGPTAENFYNRGCCFHRAGNADLARADYLECLQRSTEIHLQCLDNLIALQVADAPASNETIALLEARLEVEESTEKRIVLADHCIAAGLTEKGVEHYRVAVEADPVDPNARFRSAAQRLCTTGFASNDGLRARWHLPSFIEKNPPRPIPLVNWTDEPLAGKRLFVAAEQGIGDMTLFASRLGEIEAASVTMEIDERLIATFRNSFPEVDFRPAPWSSMTVPDVNWAEQDLFCYAGDLLYRSDREAQAGAWLVPVEEKVRRWRGWLSGFDGLRIGISWRGGSAGSEVGKHPLDAARFASLISGLPATFVLLQYDVEPDECAVFGDNFVIPPGINIRDDLDDIVALTSLLDLVITIDNCNVSFGAATGTPVWALLPAVADWRWRTHAPLNAWRQCVDHYRATPEGWDAPLAELQEDLETLVESNLPRTFLSPGQNQTTPSCADGPLVVCDRPGVLIVNDMLNSSDWGESIASMGLHDMVGRQNRAVTSLPDYALRAIRLDSCADSPDALAEGFDALMRQQPALYDALTQADEIYFLPAADPARAELLKFLAVCADQRLSKRVSLCDDLSRMLTAGLSRIGEVSPDGSFGTICTLSSHVSAESAAELITKLESLNEPVTVLLGGRAFLSEAQQTVAGFAHSRANAEIRWIESPVGWVSAIAGAQRLITPSVFAQEVRNLVLDSSCQNHGAR